MSSTAVDTYLAREKAIREKWITPADQAVIEARARKTAYRSETEPEFQRRVATKVASTANDMDRNDRAILRWAYLGLLELSGQEMDVRPRELAYGADALDALVAYRATVEAKLAEREAEAAEDPSFHIDTDLHADVRRWLAATPFVYHSFGEYVSEAAADAARDEVEEMLLDARTGKSIVDRTREAATRWMKAWLKDGTVL